jgi:hypothetical protein
MKQVGESRAINIKPPADLDTLLCKVFIGVRKDDGSQSEYEPVYLRNVQGSVDIIYATAISPYSITRDKEFL